MLAGAGFGDDALLAHAAGEQGLAERVVDLVGAGVEQVFALEVDLRAAEVFGEALGEVERCGAAAVVLEQGVEFGVEAGVRLGCVVGLLQLFERGHQGFGHVAAAVDAEASGACVHRGYCGRDQTCRGAHVASGLLGCRVLG